MSKRQAAWATKGAGSVAVRRRAPRGQRVLGLGLGADAGKSSEPSSARAPARDIAWAKGSTLQPWATIGAPKRPRRGSTQDSGMGAPSACQGMAVRRASLAASGDAKIWASAMLGVRFHSKPV